VDFAAAHGRADQAPAFRLDRTQLVRHPERKLEETMVDAADLPNDAKRRNRFLRRRKSRHAVRHSIESAKRLSQSVRRIAATEFTTAGVGPSAYRCSV